MKRKQPQFLILLVIIFVSCGLVVVGLYWQHEQYGVWDQQEIEDYLGVAIPDSAKRITFDGFLHNGLHLWLRFEAPINDAEVFAYAVCNTELHEHYNPFESTIDIRDIPRSELDRIQIIRAFSASYNIPYYSYSPEATEVDLGSICNTSYRGLRLVHINRSDPALAVVTIEDPPAIDCTIYPCHGGMRLELFEFSTGQPIHLMGLKTIDGQYVLIGSQICLDFDDPLIPLAAGRPNLIDAVIEVHLDGEQMPLAHISQQGMINANDVSETDSFVPFDYCISPAHGIIHQLNIRIIEVSGTEHHLELNFLSD